MKHILCWCLVTLMACNGGEPTAETTTEKPTPYLADPTDAELPNVDPAQLSAGIEEAFSALFVFDLEPLLTGYETALSEAEDGCPLWGINDGNAYWAANCVTEAGAQFDGYGSHFDYSTIDNGDGMIYTGSLISSVSNVTTRNGDTFTGGGVAYAMVGNNGMGFRTAGFGTSGGFDWSGSEADNSWMKTAPHLDIDVLQQAGEGFQLFMVDGTVDGLQAVQAVVFQDLVAVDHAGRIDGCEREPNGSVAVFDNQGHWFDIQLDGYNTEGNVDSTAGCDGCATAWHQGHPITTVCLNADLIYDWSL